MCFLRCVKQASVEDEIEKSGKAHRKVYSNEIKIHNKRAWRGEINNYTVIFPK